MADDATQLYKTQIMSKEEYSVSVDGSAKHVITSDEISQLDIIELPDKSGYHLLHEGRSYNISILEHDPESNTYLLKINDYEYSVNVEDRWSQLIQKMGLDKKANKAISGMAAPMPGLIRSIEVKVGDTAESGSILVVMEAMKMENQLKAPATVTIAEVLIEPGQVVDKGQQLLNFTV